MALTVGVATVLEAREVVVVVTGQRKSLALSKGASANSDLLFNCLFSLDQRAFSAIEEGINHLTTLSALQMHPWALIVADEDATAGEISLSSLFCHFLQLFWDVTAIPHTYIFVMLLRTARQNRKIL